MRILHTSDWHIGATFDAISREDDHRLFFAWLLETIERERVDVLIVAGDVFDQAHPSAESQRLYYGLLRELSKTRLRKTIVVAGNHDSAARLEAPRELLEALTIGVVGAVSSDDDSLDRAIIAVRDDAGGVALVVLAVPFVHEYRLGVRMVGRESSEIQSEFRDHFRALYAGLVERAAALYPGVPLVATGHMACVGSTPDDAPAEIHLVGTLGGLPADVFDPRLAYVALGHVHRAYRVSDAPLAYYSGSPIAFSRKEAKPARTVRVVDVGLDAKVETRALEVPAFRNIVEIDGTFEDISTAIREGRWPRAALPTLGCITLRSPTYDADAEPRIRKLIADDPARNFVLAELRTVRVSIGSEADSAAPLRALSDLRPEEVFEALCAHEGEVVDAELLSAFREALSLAAEEAR